MSLIYHSARVWINWRAWSLVKTSCYLALHCGDFCRVFEMFVMIRLISCSKFDFRIELFNLYVQVLYQTKIFYHGYKAVDFIIYWYRILKPIIFDFNNMKKIHGIHKCIMHFDHKEI